MLWIQLKITGTSHLFVGAFYRPPDNDNPEYFDVLNRSLATNAYMSTCLAWEKFQSRLNILGQLLCAGLNIQGNTMQQADRYHN
ncbi:hypothetical protein DPMN_026050 [Dreissena polymorpha]|uniref:Uncharacterized protein n=1 Tax=Dreissena polymorpha TaxID=45954 RepID=A0A9D4RDW2_DREPO|nr:hypothetical protein DPMN_026050 [Dreissena polymorpha]